MPTFRKSKTRLVGNFHNGAMFAAETANEIAIMITAIIITSYNNVIADGKEK